MVVITLPSNTKIVVFEFQGRLHRRDDTHPKEGYVTRTGNDVQYL